MTMTYFANIAIYNLDSDFCHSDVGLHGVLPCNCSPDERLKSREKCFWVPQFHHVALTFSTADKWHLHVSSPVQIN